MRIWSMSACQRSSLPFQDRSSSRPPVGEDLPLAPSWMGPGRRWPGERALVPKRCWGGVWKGESGGLSAGGAEWEEKGLVHQWWRWEMGRCLVARELRVGSRASGGCASQESSSGEPRCSSSRSVDGLRLNGGNAIASSCALHVCAQKGPLAFPGDWVVSLIRASCRWG